MPLLKNATYLCISYVYIFFKKNYLIDTKRQNPGNVPGFCRSDDGSNENHLESLYHLVRNFQDCFENFGKFPELQIQLKLPLLNL
jgi:hypothetical protein